MNCLQKQLVLGNGKTLYERAKEPNKYPSGSPMSALDCSMLDMGKPAPPPRRVSVEEFEADMKWLKGKA